MSADSFRAKVLEKKMEQTKDLLFECVMTYDIAKLSTELKTMTLEMVECIPNMRDKDGSTLLNKAAYENNHKMFDCLIFHFK